MSNWVSRWDDAYAPPHLCAEWLDTMTRHDVTAPATENEMGDQQFLPGTLEILILKTLSGGAMHGYAIGAWLEQSSDSVLSVEEGSLYPALYRMERKGWLKAEWRITEKNRRAKFYRLTRAGRAKLNQEAKAWARFSAAMSTVLNGEGPAPTKAG